MNLRLDADSIRLRVTLAEASRLASEFVLKESLPFFDGDLILQVSVGDASGFIPRADRRQIDFNLSRTKLEAILNSVSNSCRPRKEECEIREVLEIGDRSVEVRFEVDRLSLNNQGEMKYDSKSN